MALEKVQLHFAFVGPIIGIRVLAEGRRPLYGDIEIKLPGYDPFEKIQADIEANFILIGVGAEWLKQRISEGADFMVAAYVRHS